MSTCKSCCGAGSLTGDRLGAHAGYTRTVPCPACSVSAPPECPSCGVELVGRSSRERGVCGYCTAVREAICAMCGGAPIAVKDGLLRCEQCIDVTVCPDCSEYGPHDCDYQRAERWAS